MLKRQSNPDLQFSHILPYGAAVEDSGVRFVIFSRHATGMRVLLYDKVNDVKPSQMIDFDPDQNRWGDVWSILIPDVGCGQLYHFQASGPYEPAKGHRFDAKQPLIDPYALALAGRFEKTKSKLVVPPKCVVVDESFDWEGDRPLQTDIAESIIYELHVRGFTQHVSSDTAYGGTYRGLIDKIPYLKSLGITAVELLPVHEFPTNHHDGTSPKRLNYWGYDSLSFFSPHRGYSFDQNPGGQVREFKQMVREFHRAGIEVILDVVYNHTCEGNHLGPTVSFKGLDNSIYYMLEHDKRHYRNYSGCGNTVNCNHPIVRELILHSLRHWVRNYHIDGFRFDLASILSRGQNGDLANNSPLIEAISSDPLLADTKIIAEAWDAAGAYQVGTFGDRRWADWNGRFRDDIRKYWRGDSHMQGALASRLSGSSDIYDRGGRCPLNSVNFITSHDGFTLNDLVSYNHKHNLANGEENRDGDNNNYSYNHGVEGDTTDVKIDELRLRQIKNFLTTLLLSQGVPMLVAGDEFRRTQKGNNNAYCQDNEVSWIDWSMIETHAELYRFAQELIHFRRRQPTVRRRKFLTGLPQDEDSLPDVFWFGANGTPIDWHSPQSALVCWLSALTQIKSDPQAGHDLLFFLNPLMHDLEFVLPEVMLTRPWRTLIDTSGRSPHDIFPALKGPKNNGKSKMKLAEKTMVVLISED